MWRRRRRHSQRVGAPGRKAAGKHPPVTAAPTRRRRQTHRGHRSRSPLETCTPAMLRATKVCPGRGAWQHTLTAPTTTNSRRCTSSTGSLRRCNDALRTKQPASVSVHCVRAFPPRNTHTLPSAQSTFPRLVAFFAHPGRLYLAVPTGVAAWTKRRAPEQGVGLGCCHRPPAPTDAPLHLPRQAYGGEARVRLLRLFSPPSGQGRPESNPTCWRVPFA